MRNTTKLYDRRELQTMMSIAAFISGGMHTEVGRLDEAKDACGTGCLEFVTEATKYSPHIENLFQAAVMVEPNVPGVFEYEVCETFGLWFINAALEAGVVPTDEQVHGYLACATIEFFAADASRGQLRIDLRNAVCAVVMGAFE